MPFSLSAAATSTAASRNSGRPEPPESHFYVAHPYFYSRKPGRFPVETVWPFNYGSSAQSAAAGVPVGSILSAYRCAHARKRDFRLSSVSPPSSLSAFPHSTASARHISKLQQMRQK